MILGEQKKCLKLMWIVIAFSMGYAVLRYNVFGVVAWKDVPIFIVNKAASMAAIILLTFSFSISPLTNLGMPVFYLGKDSRKILGILGLLLTIFHVLLSFLIFTPNYYPNFFNEDHTLSPIGNISLLAGIVSFMVLGLYHWCFKNRSKGKEAFIKMLTSKTFLMGLLFMFGVHLFFMGYSNWLQPSKWQGGLPPISLLSFVVVIIGFTINGFWRVSKR